MIDDSVVYQCTVCGTKQGGQSQADNPVCLVCGVPKALIKVVDDALVRKSDSTAYSNDNDIDDEDIDE